jgi:hypothetical protein
VRIGLGPGRDRVYEKIGLYKKQMVTILAHKLYIVV